MRGGERRVLISSELRGLRAEERRIPANSKYGALLFDSE
jgi:hypothetical protein